MSETSPDELSGIVERVNRGARVERRAHRARHPIEAGDDLILPGFASLGVSLQSRRFL